MWVYELTLVLSTHSDSSVVSLRLVPREKDKRRLDLNISKSYKYREMVRNKLLLFISILGLIIEGEILIIKTVAFVKKRFLEPSFSSCDRWTQWDPQLSLGQGQLFLGLKTKGLKSISYVLIMTPKHSFFNLLETTLLIFKTVRGQTPF